MRHDAKTPDSLVNSRTRPALADNPAWARLTAKYLTDLPRQLDSITRILELRDYKKIKTHAHRIKGTSGTYQLETISRGAERLERLADSRNPDRVGTAIKEVKRLIEMETTRLEIQTASSHGEETNRNG